MLPSSSEISLSQSGCPYKLKGISTIKILKLPHSEVSLTGLAVTLTALNYLRDTRNMAELETI
jgi:hypothetical protein